MHYFFSCFKESWENFFEKKFSQTLSKNFNGVTRRERRVTKILIGKRILLWTHLMILLGA